MSVGFSCKAKTTLEQSNPKDPMAARSFVSCINSKASISPFNTWLNHFAKYQEGINLILVLQLNHSAEA